MRFLGLFTLSGGEKWIFGDPRGEKNRHNCRLGRGPGPGTNPSSSLRTTRRLSSCGPTADNHDLALENVFSIKYLFGFGPNRGLRHTIRSSDADEGVQLNPFCFQSSCSGSRRSATHPECPKNTCQQMLIASGSSRLGSFVRSGTMENKGTPSLSSLAGERRRSVGVVNQSPAAFILSALHRQFLHQTAVLGSQRPALPSHTQTLTTLSDKRNQYI